MKKLQYAAVLTLSLAFSAQAEESSPPTSIWGDKTEVTIGLGAGVAPRYLGAKDYEVMPLPSLSIYRGIFFVDTLRGIGMEYLTSTNTYLSGAINYDPGRKDRNSSWTPGSDRLAGMGDVKGSTVGNVLISQEITPWLSVNGEANFRLGGQKHRGNDYRLGVEGKILEKSSDTLTANLNAHLGDSKFNRTYFGVTRNQANRSRFNYHGMDSGMYALSYGVDWIHKIDKNWSVFTAVNVMHFMRDAKNSPVVERKVGVTGAVSVNYSF